MTYNIRYNNRKDEVNAWPNRKDRVLKLVFDTRADVIGFQEALHDQVEFLDSELDQYQRVGVGRDDGKSKGEYSPIYFDTSRFELGENGTFWLSEKPNEPGSKSWDAAITRICSFVQLKDKRSRNTLWVFNTHFDHKGSVAREESAKLILSRARSLAGKEVFLIIGDLNFGPESEGYITLAQQIQDTFECYESGPITTGKGFEVGEKEGGRIDHILHSQLLSCTKYRIIEDNDGKHYPSDHLPVVAKLKFADE